MDSPAPEEEEPSSRDGRPSLQDRLLEKLLQGLIPSGSGAADGGLVRKTDSTDTAAPAFARPRPNFNITTMSTNFRRFNARIGVVFRFQAHALALLSWRRSSHTLALLVAYSLVCLDPHLAAAVPLALLVAAVFVPAFLARHPAPAGSALASPDIRLYGCSGRGPATQTVRPSKEPSDDFFSHIRDLQNSMDDFCRAHDTVVAAVVPLTDFSHEARSSGLCASAVLACGAMTVAAPLVPWRLVALATGWAAVVSGHPAAARLFSAAYFRHLLPRARAWLDAWVAHDIVLDSAPDTREVEVFELQHHRSTPAAVSSPVPAAVSRSRSPSRCCGPPTDGAEWEPWLFSPVPYDPLSRPRTSGDRPRGTRFFEDVLPPVDWEWSEKKWALDLWSRDWVEDRIITAVEVEVEGERWVYDMLIDGAGPAPYLVPYPDDDDGDGDGDDNDDDCAGAGRRNDDEPGRRGEWRRRRWVRLVKRRSGGR